MNPNIHEQHQAVQMPIIIFLFLFNLFFMYCYASKQIPRAISSDQPSSHGLFTALEAVLYFLHHGRRGGAKHRRGS